MVVVSMTIGTLERSYELGIQGIELKNPIKFSLPKPDLQAMLESGAPLNLSVRVANTTQLIAEAHAARFTRELYQRLLLRFAASIEGSDPPRIVQTTFTAPGTPATVQTGTAAVPTHGLPARRAPVVIAPADIDALRHEVEMRAFAPQRPTSAQLYTAIDWYVVGLQSNNKVVRFLVFYSALSLAALFKKYSPRLRQDKVDSLLLGVIPGLPVCKSPQNGKETIYTKLRNNLIHPEGRGCDPTKAINDIELRADQFQKDVSRVLLSL